MYSVSTPTRVGDLYLLDRKGGQPRQLTHVNDALFGKLNLTEPEEMWYMSFDGKKVQAWVQKPPDFDPNKNYPLILNIHGGPHAAAGDTFQTVLSRQKRRRPASASALVFLLMNSSASNWIGLRGVSLKACHWKLECIT